VGLTVIAKGLSPEKSYDCGYITYGNFLMSLIREVYGERCYDSFKKSLISGKPFTAEEEAHWNFVCDDDLEVWIWHSDCDGKFTPDECRRIYKAIKDVHMDLQGHNYGDMKPYNMLERWKEMFLHCARRRVNLYFT